MMKHIFMLRRNQMEAAPVRDYSPVIRGIAGAALVSALTTGASPGCSSTEFERATGEYTDERVETNEYAYDSLVAGESNDYRALYGDDLVKLGTANKEVQEKAAKQNKKPAQVLAGIAFDGMHSPRHDDSRDKLYSMCVLADIAGALDPADIKHLVAMEEEYKALPRKMEDDQADSMRAFCREELVKEFGEDDKPHQIVQAPGGKWTVIE
jgi:hypothetical protein